MFRSDCPASPTGDNLDLSYDLFFRQLRDFPRSKRRRLIFPFVAMQFTVIIVACTFVQFSIALQGGLITATFSHSAYHKDE